MSNKHTVLLREVIISYRQKEMLRRKDMRTALWLESVLVDTSIRKARIILKYHLKRNAKYRVGQIKNYCAELKDSCFNRGCGITHEMCMIKKVLPIALQ